MFTSRPLVLFGRAALRLPSFRLPAASSSSSSAPAAALLATRGQNDSIANVRLIDATDPKNVAIELELADEAEILRIPLVWFRDHCRAAAHFDWTTGQRHSNPAELFARARLGPNAQSAVRFDERTQRLRIRWADGHESEFATAELLDWAIFTRKDYDDYSSRSFWSRDNLREVPNVSAKNFDFTLFARLFLRFGVVLVDGVDARNERATKRLCESIAPLHEMLGGDFWVVETSDGDERLEDFEVETRCLRHGNEHAHEAVRPAAFGPHTTAAFLEQTPGIRAVHVLKAPAEGGEMRLVDGFAIAQKLRDETPQLFDLLASTPVEHHRLKNAPKKQRSRVEDDDDEFPADSRHERRPSPIVTAVEPPEPPPPPTPVHARSIHRPVIEFFKHKVVQIRFSPADRAPLRTLRVVQNFDDAAAALNADRTVRFYEAYARFAQLAHDEAAAVQVALRPGAVLFIDNYRVLHSQREHSGPRKMCGCYLSRDALLAKARPLLSAAYRNV
ncbi:Epsilon-trimethyllysine 2-oxoglutarate dioxygenase [Aphelenchoides fujianensis]|nr:Epsilon-trimethyllysine 2-oxoglutarate dioxygenase [Aphelenchoides fujianensis]